jgi:uncharacterized RDD family membrane protein YckC/type II secretory pathway pseudopilin PulG
MICAKCGTTNSENATSCDSCGASLITFAPTAGELNAAAALLDADYAGFWRRFAAVFLDGIVLGLIFLPIALVLGFTAGMLGLGNSLTANIAINLLSLLASAAYFVVMESGEQGATFGKRWVKIRVVDGYGERISKARAFARWAAHFLSYITLLIGFLIQPFTMKKQALHDKVAGTLIVRTDKGGSVATVIIAIVAFIFMLGFIAILAAVAIPAYQDYVVKAKVVRALEVGNTASKAVEDYYIRTGRIPASIAETHTLLQPYQDIAGVTVNGDSGEVRVIFSDSLPSSIARKRLALMPTQRQDGGIEWKCSSDIDARYLPAACK